MTTDNKIFYNYVYLDPRKPGNYSYDKLIFDYEPFYVGKGKYDRHLDHLKETTKRTSNPKKFNKIQKIRSEGLEPIVLKIYENLEETIAFQNEIYLINVIGRHGKKLGPLTNLDDGGKGSNNTSKKIYQYDLDGTFIESYESQREIYHLLNINNLNACLNGKNLTASNFIWSYVPLTDNDIKIKIEKIRKRKTTPKKIYQYDLNFNFIKEFKSITIAEKNTNTNYSLISNCLNNRSKTAGGFIWKFEKNIDLKIILDERITELFKYDLNGNLIKKYKSTKEASIDNSIHNIHKSITDKKILGGFIWSYSILSPTNFSVLLNDINTYYKNKINKPKPVNQYTLDNVFIKQYSTICEAGKFTNINRGGISYCCNGKQKSAGGFIWKYKI